VKQTAMVLSPNNGGLIKINKDNQAARLTWLSLLTTKLALREKPL